MYGAFIGDIVGSKYEFNNIITKQFPLFSPGCDYTDDTIMTVAVAKAILLSREEQFKRGENGKGFQEFLIEVMQDFGRRYPHPTGAYGGSFAKWLRQKNPKPYGSYGNGSAMRVSPCGLAAVTMEEALALARASASVSHDHPEGIKGAEAVSAAVFLAKCGRTKEEIGQYISEHYYNLDFTLDSIRETYKFDGSCQGSVPQAIVAFLESENFEDAIRNVISIGGDCDTTGAIAGSIAWIYYAVQTGSYSGWVYDKFDSAMLEIKVQAMSYLPKEFIDIADEFHEVCWKRAGTFDRVGGCTPILNRDEIKKYWTDWAVPPIQHRAASSDPLTADIETAVTAFCNKYVVLMEVLYRDKELNQWCRNYSAYKENTTHRALEELIYNGFMKEAYALGFLPKVLAWKPGSAYSLGSALCGTKADLLYGICMEIRADYGCNGALIYHAIASGSLYYLMNTLLHYEDKPEDPELTQKVEKSFSKNCNNKTGTSFATKLSKLLLKKEDIGKKETSSPHPMISGGQAYSLAYIQGYEGIKREHHAGARYAWHDKTLGEWRLTIQLDNQGIWFLSVFVKEDGRFEKYSLDYEMASDFHYEFRDEKGLRKKIYSSGDEKKYLAEVLIRYVQMNGGNALLSALHPFITAQYHYD